VSDFSQAGAITTLHRLGETPLDAMEFELQRFARTRRIALVLPCLFDEFSRPALRGIVENLRRVRYLDRIVVSLGRTTADGVAYAQEFFAPLPQRVSFVWNDGPRLQGLYRRLREQGLAADRDGKGRSFWIACGYLLASRDCDVIAVHDCDITTYDRELLARLCYPVVHPDLGFEFAKGYYARVSQEMRGRVTRLFVAPLIRALRRVWGRLPLLDYLDSFRYPLAGEFAMSADLARATRVPGDWGLEIGVLAEVYRHSTLRRVCQTELCDRYDHKHQTLGAGEPETGLMKMCIDVGQSFLRALAAEGVAVTASATKEILVQYIRAAADLMRRYRADAAINGLIFEREREDETVLTFADALRIACDRYASDSRGAPSMPSWDRVMAAIPEFGALLHHAVDEDSRPIVLSSMSSGAA
jgi:glucosyl-3-phosphoglycerate synthase